MSLQVSEALREQIGNTGDMIFVFNTGYIRVDTMVIT